MNKAGIEAYLNMLDLTGKNVLVIGEPASGKSTWATYISERWPAHTLIRTDDYKKYGYEASLYVLMQDIRLAECMGEYTIVEGVIGYRALRKGLEEGTYYPDVVLEFFTTPEKVEQVYAEQRGGIKPGLRQFTAGLQTILNKYKIMPNPRPPADWIALQNEYYL